MRQTLLPTMLAILTAAPVLAAAPQGPRPPANEILNAVVASLPRDPLRISGRLVVRRPRGVVTSTLGFEMRLNWGQNPPSAHYTISDAFGRRVAGLHVTQSPDGGNATYMFDGTNTPASRAELFRPIGDTDITWIDLSLGFLWWASATNAGSDQFRGQDCWIVDARDPGAAQPASGLSQPYATARLWIDTQRTMLLQAEGLDASGRCVRRMWVRSFKRIDDRWMLKDLEIQARPFTTRTKLRVDEVHVMRPGGEEALELDSASDVNSGGNDNGDIEIITPVEGSSTGSPEAVEPATVMTNQP